MLLGYYVHNNAYVLHHEVVYSILVISSTSLISYKIMDLALSLSAQNKINY
jgi:hypothetical protein